MSLLFHTYLLAIRNPFSDMGAGFRDKKEHFDGSELVLYAGLVVGFFCLIAAIAWIINRRDRHQLYNSPRALFRALCRAHQLDRKQRRLVAQVASAAGYSHRSQVFLDPSAFEGAADDAAFARRKEEIVELAQRFFATAEATPES